jgi:hypothetical protein
MPVAWQYSQGIGSFSVMGLIVVQGVKRRGTRAFPAKTGEPG